MSGSVPLCATNPRAQPPAGQRLLTCSKRPLALRLQSIVSSYKGAASPTDNDASDRDGFFGAEANGNDDRGDHDTNRTPTRTPPTWRILSSELARTLVLERVHLRLQLIHPALEFGRAVY